MKYIAAAALALFGVAACHNANINTRSQPVTISTTDSITRRSNLEKALQELQKAIASRDKHRIGDYFQFPVPDSVATFYANDSAYDREREKEGEFMSKRLFEKCIRWGKICAPWLSGPGRPYFASHFSGSSQISPASYTRKSSCPVSPSCPNT